jgi:hypothetical protein
VQGHLAHRRRCRVDTDADADPDADPNTDADPDADPNTDADPDADPNSNADANSNSGCCTGSEGLGRGRQTRAGLHTAHLGGVHPSLWTSHSGVCARGLGFVNTFTRVRHETEPFADRSGL